MIAYCFFDVSMIDDNHETFFFFNSSQLNIFFAYNLLYNINDSMTIDFLTKTLQECHIFEYDHSDLSYLRSFIIIFSRIILSQSSMSAVHKKSTIRKKLF